MLTFLQIHWVLTSLALLLVLLASKPRRQFIRRNFWLAVGTAASLVLSLNHEVFDALGPIVFVLSTCTVVSLVSRIAVAINNPATIDKDAHRETGEKLTKLERDWQEVDARTRVIVSAAVKVGYLIAFALIAAAVGK